VLQGFHGRRARARPELSIHRLGVSRPPQPAPSLRACMPSLPLWPTARVPEVDWKWPSRCCCRSAAGPMSAADPRRTMHQTQLALQHACPQSSFSCPIRACARWHPSIPDAHINKTSPKGPTEPISVRGTMYGYMGGGRVLCEVPIRGVCVFGRLKPHCRRARALTAGKSIPHRPLTAQ
jgi:hypothetical protein